MVLWSDECESDVYERIGGIFFIMVKGEMIGGKEKNEAALIISSKLWQSKMVICNRL